MAFIPLSQYRAQTTATAPAPRPAPTQAPAPIQSGADSDLGKAIAAGRVGTSLAGITGQLTGTRLGALTTGASSLLSAAQAYRNFAQGKNTQGALNTAASIGGGLRLGANYLPASLSRYAPIVGTAGSALGAATGLAGAGLALSQGDIRGGIQGLVGGAGSLASLAPAGMTLGGVPIASSAGGILGTGLGAGASGAAAGGAAAGGATAAGAGGGAAAGAAGGAGAGAAAGVTVGASIAGALGAIGLVLAVGFAVENIVNAALGEGAYGKSPLPFGRHSSQPFSSAENLASQKSKFIGIQGANVLGGAIQKSPSKDPGWLLGIAGAGSGLSPHGEIQFSSKYGHGGDWDDPQSPEFAASLKRAEAGDIPTLKDLLSTMEIRTGEGGVTNVNPKLTEAWRAKLLYSLPPETQRALGRDLNTLMGPVSKDNLEAMFYRHQVLNPSRDGFIRFGAVKLPMNHEYRSYNIYTSPPSYDSISPEQAVLGIVGNAQAQAVKGQTWEQNPTLIYDKTTGKSLSQALPQGGGYQINPEYLDMTRYGKERTASQAEQARQAALKAAEAAQRQADNEAWAAGPGSM